MRYEAWLVGASVVVTAAVVVFTLSDVEVARVLPRGAREVPLPLAAIGGIQEPWGVGNTLGAVSPAPVGADGPAARVVVRARAAGRPVDIEDRSRWHCVETPLDTTFNGHVMRCEKARG